MGERSYVEKFINPSYEFQPATYWFWQYIPNKQEIEQQLNEILQAGYHTFYIQPRLAFPIELYLSDEYLEAYRYAIEFASKLGLKAGIYDDYNWNTGHGGGLTVRGHDEYREKQLFWSSKSVEGKSTTLKISDIRTLMGDSLGGPQGQWTYEGGKPVWSEWELVKVVAYAPDHELSTKETFEDLRKYCSVTSQGDNQCIITIDLPNDKYVGQKITAFVSGRCITSRHINYLDKQATTRFIEVGYEPYKKAVGDYFGSTIFCMFMDHPHAGFYSWKQAEGNIKNSLMYDVSLEDTFHAEHNYPIEVSWLSFILPESKLTSKLRGDFFNTYGRLARENFLGQLSEWSHQNGLMFAGHELFGFLGIWGFYGGYHVVDQRTDFGGDYFGIGQYKDISTVDAYNSIPQISAKVGDSVARANGQHGCMLEQYYFNTDSKFPGAIGQWDLTFEEMRAQAIRHTFFGTKQFIFHGYYLTDTAGEFELLASSRFDFAPGINYEPWFIHHKKFAQEISRLSAFIYDADPITEVAVLYPLTSYWVEGSDGILGEESAAWHQELLENGIGFDIVNELQISFDKSIPGHIQAGNNLYKILVLPGATVLKNTDGAYEISEFVKSGGVLLISGDIPSETIEDGQSPEILNLFKNLINENKKVHFFSNAAETQDQINEVIKSYLPGIPNFINTNVSSGQTWSWAGKDDSSYLLALFNDSSESSRQVINIPLVNVRVERWDPKTGNRNFWSWFKESGDYTQIYIDLEPQETACFRIEHAATPSLNSNLIASDLPVLSASIGEKETILKILGDHQGDFEYTIKTSNGLENRTLTIANLPESIALVDNWKFKTASGSNFHPIDIAKGWEQQGYEDYIGEGIYQIQFNLSKLSEDWENWHWMLEFPSIVSSAEIILNGKSQGQVSWLPSRILLPPTVFQPDKNILTLKVYNTAGNHYYAGSPYNVPKYPSGVIGAPVFKPMKLFILSE